MKAQRIWIVLLVGLFVVSCSSFNAEYDQVMKSDSVDQLQAFLDKWEYKTTSRSDSEKFDFVYSKLRNLRYDQAKKQGTLVSYKAFVNQYWNSRVQDGKVREIRELSFSLRKKQIKNKERKPDNWRDLHALLNSNFHDNIISKPPLNVKPQYVYTWNGELVTDLNGYLIFRHDDGMFAVKKPVRETPISAELSLNTHFIVIGLHSGNEKFTNMIGGLVTVPVLQSGLVFSYEPHYKSKL